MRMHLAAAAAGLSLGLGLALSGASAAEVQRASNVATSAVKTEGGVTLDRARGRVGGGYYRGGRGYGRGARIGGGIAAGIAGAIILNEVYRSSRPTYYYSGSGLSCGQLEYRCDNGADWACRRLDNDPRC